MTKKKTLENFIKKIYKLKVPIRYVKDDPWVDVWHPLGVVFQKEKPLMIVVNTTWLNRDGTTSYDIKALLLHEIGHMCTYSKRKSEWECLAQLWAIQKAQELNLKVIKNFLITTLVGWKDFNWSTSDRRYVLAYKEAKKLGLIPEEKHISKNYVKSVHLILESHHHKNKSIEKIAEDIRMSCSTVKKYIKKFGIHKDDQKKDINIR